MFSSFCLILLFFQWSECCKSAPYTFKIKGTTKPDRLGQFPWLVVIKDKADPVFKLGYGALIHPQIIITADLTIQRYALRNILIQTNCSISKIWVPTDCIERQVVNMISSGKEQKCERFYDDYILLILERPLLMDPIRMIDDITSINPKNCFFLRWMREMGDNDSRELVTVKYKISFNNGHVNLSEFNARQLWTDRDFIVSRELHAEFIVNHIENQNLLNFIGSPLICQDIKNHEDYFLVGIGTFSLKIREVTDILEIILSSSFIDVVEKGSFINIVDFSEQILEDINSINSSLMMNN